MQRIKVPCVCGKTVEVSVSLLCNMGKCKACGRLVRVPTAGAEVSHPEGVAETHAHQSPPQAQSDGAGFGHQRQLAEADKKRRFLWRAVITTFAVLLALGIGHASLTHWQRSCLDGLAAKLKGADDLRESDPLKAYRIYEDVLAQGGRYWIWWNKELQWRLDQAKSGRDNLYPKVKPMIAKEKPKEDLGKQAVENNEKSITEIQRLEQSSFFKKYQISRDDSWANSDGGTTFYYKVGSVPDTSFDFNWLAGKIKGCDISYMGGRNRLSATELELAWDLLKFLQPDVVVGEDLKAAIQEEVESRVHRVDMAKEHTFGSFSLYAGNVAGDHILSLER